MALQPICRLCGGSDAIAAFYKDKVRSYLQCRHCHVIFVPDNYIVSAEEEKAEYDLHDNFNDDEGYRRFLSRAAEPLAKHFGEREATAVVKGLDFGCGPNPLLAKVLSSAPYNFDVDIYDKYYFPEKERLLAAAQDEYDFITATEVFEHLRFPLLESENLWKALRPGGILVIMTKRAEGTVGNFHNWHYIRDRTHIIFMTEAAFHWLASHLSSSSGYPCSVRFERKDIAVLLKCDHPGMSSSN